MIGTSARRPVAALLIAGLAALPLVGCESVTKETGLGRETQMGALGGAAFGGVVAAIAGANPAWIAASVIMGGVAGGALGNYLGKENSEKHVANNTNALNTLGAGQTASWNDNATGNSGSTKIDRVFTASNGQTCKAYTETVKTAQRTVTEQATACRQADGTWKVQTA
jgi:surface antigen